MPTVPEHQERKTVKSAVETLNPTRVKLTVEVPFEELKPSLDAAYKAIAQQITIPGFRKGKVPAAIIDQRIGREPVLEQAVNDSIPRLYVQALQENELEPLSQPQVDIAGYGEGQPLEFSVELDVAPDITVPDYDGLEVSVDDADVSDADVDEQVEGLRQRFGSLTDVERAAAKDDFVTIDLSAAKDGEPIEEAQTSGYSYQVGSGTMLDGLDDALDGMSVGESTTFTSALVGGEHAGEEVDVTVTVSAVKEQELPEVDDDFAQLASEFDTVEELKGDLTERLRRAKRIEQAGAARDAVLERLLDLVEIPLPDQVVADEKQARRDQISQQLAYAGLTEAQYLESEGQTEEEFEADLERRVRDALAARFLLDEVAKNEQLGVDETELTQQIVRRAQQMGVQPDEYAQQAMQEGQVPELVGEVRRGKALAMIVEAANVVDESGNSVELKRLLPDGTFASEQEAVEAAASDDSDESPSTETTSEAASEATSIVTDPSFATPDEDADKKD
jgi:trigger factor